jgi:hypothetical protein
MEPWDLFVILFVVKPDFELIDILFFPTVPPWWVMEPGDSFVILYVVKPDFELFNALFFPAVPPRWVMEPGDSFVILKKSVALDCLTTGTPEPVITWQKALGQLLVSVHTV